MSNEPWFPIVLSVVTLFALVALSTQVATSYTKRRPFTSGLLRVPPERPRKGVAALEVPIVVFLIGPIHLVILAYLIGPEHHPISRIAAAAELLAAILWVVHLARLPAD